MNPAPWLLLVISLPGQNQTLRMRVWRALKAVGAGVLRDGVYVLPNTEAARAVFEEQAGEIRGGGGTTHLLTFDSASATQRDELVALFDRGAEYSDLFGRLDTFKSELASVDEAEARRRLAALRREVAATTAIDFFPGAAGRQVEGALADAEAGLNARFSPDEPHAAAGTIPRRQREDYRGRLWATREHLWIDRVASAWLIRRFIDTKAKFLWLQHAVECPREALGFDFDGAEFTHVGGRVSFEVLLASFGLDGDAALAAIGHAVHALDVGGIPVADAKGLETILRGVKSKARGDDEALREAGKVLDLLYSAYAEKSAVPA
jgi:hypothetical protein